LDRWLALEAFRLVLIRRDGFGGEGKLRPRRIAVEAHRLYCRELGSAAPKPSWFSFKRLISGKDADKTVIQLLELHRVAKRERRELDRNRVLAAFRRAVGELCSGAAGSSGVRPFHVVQRAQEVYAEFSGGSGVPPVCTFEPFVYGRRADAEVSRLLEGAGIRKRGKLDRRRLLDAFRAAVEEFQTLQASRPIGVMAVADRAHRHYVKDLEKDALRPSPRTFRHLVSGKSADAEVRGIFENYAPFRKKHL